MKDEKLKLELANIICNEKFNTKKLRKILGLIERDRKAIFDKLDKVRITVTGDVKLETFFDYKDIKINYVNSQKKPNKS